MICERFVLLATGFAQPERVSNGMRQIEIALSKLELPAGTMVQRLTWLERASVAARIILKNRNAAGGPPQIILAGHSFGGWFANEVATHLNGAEAKVSALLLADAVSRGNIPGTQPIVVQENVERLYTWRQEGLPPRGSEINTQPKTRIVVAKIATTTPHHKMDELPEFRDAVIAEATAPLAV